MCLLYTFFYKMHRGKNICQGQASKKIITIDFSRIMSKNLLEHQNFFTHFSNKAKIYFSFQINERIKKIEDIFCYRVC